MAKKYFDNYRLEIAYDYFFSNLKDCEWVNIHEGLSITSGDNLPKRLIEPGPYAVYGGGGETGEFHNSFNVDFQTIGIGRVGARCGCVFNIKKKSWVTDNALMVYENNTNLSFDFLRHFLSFSNLGQFANDAMQPVISKTRIAGVQLPLLNEQEQLRVVSLLNSIEKHEFIEDDESLDLLKRIMVVDDWEILTLELGNQKELTSQLKQSILQEAIKGKLTEDWRADNPDVEPATKLLERIKAEKAKLIKEKKIKKEKPLPPIEEDEIPFELPEGWVWCRLGDIIVNADNLDIQKHLSPEEIINYVDIDAIDNTNQVIREPKKLPVRELSSRARRVLTKGQILYSLVRPYLHNLAIVKEDKPNFIGSTGFAVFRCVEIPEKFIFWVLLSKYIEDLYLSYMDGFNSPSITHDQFKGTLVPIPPLLEQATLVKNIDLLFEKCRSLDLEIKQSELHSQTLIQAVLSEVFDGGKKKAV